MSSLQKIWRLSYSWKHVSFVMLLIILLSTTSTRLFPIQHFAEEKLDPINKIILNSQSFSQSEKELAKQLISKPHPRDTWLQYINFRSHKLNSANPQQQSSLYRSKPFFTDKQFADFLLNHGPLNSDLLLLYYHFRMSKAPSYLGEIQTIAQNPGDSSRRAEAYELYSQMLAFAQASPEIIARAIKNSIDLNPSDEDLKLRYLRFLQAKNLETALEEAIRDAHFENTIDSYTQIHFALKEKQWSKFLKHSLISMTQRYRLAPTLLCLLAGSGWLFLFIKITGFNAAPKIDKFALAGALLLGFFSTWLCVTVIHIQDFYIFTTPIEKLNPAKLFVFFTAGVGLREELSKLLLLLPLVPWLAKSRDPLKHLLFSAIVGLGFALEENIAYLASNSHESGILFGRFVTANFLHMMLTSYCGYYLIRAWRVGGHAWNDFAFNLTKMILLHGAYDFFLTVNFEGADFIAMMLYVATGYEFLRLLLSFMRHEQRGPSATSLLMLALAVSAAAGIYYSGSLVGLSYAVETIIPSILANAVLAYMFVKAFNDPMI